MRGKWMCSHIRSFRIGRRFPHHHSILVLSRNHADSIQLRERALRRYCRLAATSQSRSAVNEYHSLNIVLACCCTTIDHRFRSARICTQDLGREVRHFALGPNLKNVHEFVSRGFWQPTKLNDNRPCHSLIPCIPLPGLARVPD